MQFKIFIRQNINNKNKLKNLFHFYQNKEKFHILSSIVVGLIAVT